MSETDGMDDVVETGLRAGLMAATRIREQLARMREQALREMRQAEEQNARELQERFDTAQVAARAQLAPVSRDDWWNHATPEMIGQAHETATAWKDHDPAAAGDAERIRDQVQQRYGIDINNLAPGEFDIFEAAARTRNTARRAPVEQPGKTPARTDEATASAVMNSADREERANAAAAASAGPGSIPSFAGRSWRRAWTAKQTGKQSTSGSSPTSTRERTPTRQCEQSPQPPKQEKRAMSWPPAGPWSTALSAETPILVCT